MIIQEQNAIPLRALGTMDSDCESPVQLQERFNAPAITYLTGWIVSVGISKQAFVYFGLEPAPARLDPRQEAQLVDIFKDLLDSDLLSVVDAMLFIVPFADQLLFYLACREAFQPVMVA
jgi:hypothetical protein